MNGLCFYICKRIVNILSNVARVFPVKKNRITMVSYIGGSQYSDSPMYITEYLLEEFKDKYEIIWVFGEPRKFSYLKEKGIKIVKFHSFAEFYYSNTSKVYITNLFGTFPYISRRNDQMRIETSHGVAYKKLITGLSDANKVNDIERKRVKDKINAMTVCLSGSKITSEKVYREELGYSGKILEIGLPRNDIFFKDNGEFKNKVRAYFGYKKNKKLFLVMPTWKRDNNRTTFDIDYKRLIDTVQYRYGEEWIVLLRLHHLSKVDISDIKSRFKGLLYDATQYPNSQELLCCGDILMTDYSSVIWDFALREKPILIYNPDKDDYENERGFNVSPEDWQLYRARNQDDLEDIVNKHSYEELCEASRRHINLFGSYESGHATADICKIINDFCCKGGEN